jgi:regulatory factor X 4
MEVTRSPLSGGSDEEEHHGTQLRPHPTYKIMKWLDQNYMYEDGICLPRCLIYEHYSDHCQRDNATPINAASFGKLVHQQFPKITTRRLGTRGQSKYHYFGLGIQRTSRYYDVSYQQKPPPGTKKEGGGRFSHRHYKNREKPSSQLPRFPSVKEVKDGTSPEVTVDKVRTFVVMYHAHCQRIYDSVTRANFTDVSASSECVCVHACVCV